MRKKICLCIASAMLYSLLTCGAAFAAPECDVDVDTDTEIVTVSGNTGIQREAQLSLVILAAGALGADPYSKTDAELLSLAEDKLDDLTDANFASVINSFRQISTEADGDFTATFKMSAPDSGDYGAVLNYRSNGSGDLAFVVPFFYCTPEHVEKAVEAVNLADSTTIGSKLLEKYRELGLDLTEYNALATEDKPLIIQYVYAEKEALKKENSTGFSGAGAVEDAFIEALAYYELKNASAEELGVMFADLKYVALLELSKMTEYSTYTKTLDSTEQAEVLAACVGFSGCENIEDIKELFGDKTILCAVESAESWTEINPILTANKASLTEIDSAYWTLDDTSSVDKEIVEKAFDSIDELAETMKPLIESAENPDEGGDDDDDSGSSNRGGGGGGGVAITAPPVEPKTEADAEKGLPFTDMAGYDWAEEAVSTLYEMGIVSGRDETSFAPGEYVTREEFVKMLVCLLGEHDTGATADFIDAKDGAWYSSYIGSAQKSGISNGLGDGRFGVGMLITRQDIAVMACRAAGVYAGDNISAFADEAEISEYAKESVSALASQGIISGMGDGAFAPKVNATRAQAAKILFELHRWKEKTV